MRPRLLTPLRLLGLWFLLVAAADMAVLLYNMSEFNYRIPAPTELEFNLTIVEASVGAFVGLVLFSHGRAGYRYAVLLSLYFLAAGTWFGLAKPPLDLFLAMGTFYLYHGAMLRLLSSSPVVAQARGKGARRPRWLLGLSYLAAAFGTLSLLVHLAGWRP